MIVWQRNEKDGSFKEDFSDLKKCVSIWIVIHPPKELRGEILDLNLSSNSAEMHEFNDVLDTERIYIMCLHDTIDVTNKSALMMLSVLFSSKLSKEERIFILKEEYGILLSEAEREELDTMCNAHEGAVEQGKEIGKEIGKKIGIALGESNGRKIRNLEIARKMILKGMSFEDINEFTDLTYSEILNLSNQLNH